MKLGKLRLSTRNTKVPSLLSKDKHIKKLYQPTTGQPTKLNGPLKLKKLRNTKLEFKPNSKLTLH